MGSHALLLRLFLSSSFFSVHVALQYLRLYADNIGITHYLTGRLRELPIHELWDVWGFICHLLVTKPSKSVALECFIVERAEQSTHMAILTLWFMQASLNDLATMRRDTPSFVVCQRVLHKCHTIIFGDLPVPAPAPYASLTVPSRSLLLRKKVRPHVEPALVGIASVLAGAPGMPRLTEIVGKVAVEQGRREEATMRRLPMDIAAHEDVAPAAQTARSAGVVGDGSDEEEEGSMTAEQQDGPIASSSKSSMSDLAGAQQKRRDRVLGPAQTAPVLSFHASAPVSKITRASDDPLGQLYREEPGPPAAPSAYMSFPTISHTRRPTRSTSNSLDVGLQKYDLYSKEQLLRSHYLRGEVQFFLGLEAIANRLLVVPRLARVSALRAELTILNHKLPAEVCIPMWCESADTQRDSQSVSEPHHRVVRIPPGESVVLNSAERAPYLLVIEILHGDLDFDPSKRDNNDVLRRMALKEVGRKGTSVQFIGWSEASDDTPHVSGSKDDVVQEDLGNENGDVPSIGAIVPSDMSPAVEEDDEVDVTDQLDLSARSQTAALDDSIALPTVRKNKDLDMEAWSKTTSAPSSPSLLPQQPRILSLEHTRTLSESRGLRSSLLDENPTPSTNLQPTRTKVSSRTLSLEEYSERMRTAAIMLAQLNANVIREPVTTISPPGATQPYADITADAPSSLTALGRIPGSSWLPGFNLPGTSASGPSPPDANPPAMRMRLQRSEAHAIRDRIMQEMMAMEEERMERMRAPDEGQGLMTLGDIARSAKATEDESIIRRELNKEDPSAAVFRESWATKRRRIKAASPYGHLATWDCMSVIVKTGTDLRQEQLAVQLIKEFEKIWKEECCDCWVRPFRILITGGTSGLVETITDAVSIHSLKKSEYARRLAEGRLGYVTLFDHFVSAYGNPSSAKFSRAQRNFAKSLAGYSIVTYLLQIKDRHNGNILLDRDGHLIHIDFGFMLSNSPGNIGFEGAPFKLPSEYIEVLGGIDSEPFRQFKRLFHDGFEAARKHCDRIITIVELMQKDSALPCFTAHGEQTAQNLRERFQPALTHSLVGEYVERLIVTSLGSAWTRLYDSYQYYSQSIL